MIDNCVCGSHFPNLLVSNRQLLPSQCKEQDSRERDSPASSIASRPHALAQTASRDYLPSCGLIRVMYNHVTIYCLIHVGDDVNIS